MKWLILLLTITTVFSCGSRKVKKQSFLETNKELNTTDLSNDVYLDSVILSIVSKYAKNTIKTADSIVLSDNKVTIYKPRTEINENKEIKKDSLNKKVVDNSKKSYNFEKESKEELSTKDSKRNNTISFIGFVFIIVFFIFLGFKFVKRGK